MQPATISELILRPYTRDAFIRWLNKHENVSIKANIQKATVYDHDLELVLNWFPKHVHKAVVDILTRNTHPSYKSAYK